QRGRAGGAPVQLSGVDRQNAYSRSGIGVGGNNGPDGEPTMTSDHAKRNGQPFALFDCSLARLATGQCCSNLRELLEAVRTAPPAVLEHHMMRCALDDHFEMYEFPNDLARWGWDALGDHVLAEQLGLVDPYQHATI